MRILPRYILAQVWTPAALAAVLVTFVVLAGGLQRSISDLLDKVPFVQITIVDLALVSLFSLPSALGFILPVTFMFGVMFAFTRLAANSEMIAMRACGVSLKQAVMPVLAFSLLVSMLCFALQNLAQPYAMQRLSQMLTYDLPLRMTVDMLPTGVMHHYGDWRVFLGRRDPDGTLRDIMLLQPDGAGGATAFYAETARVESDATGSRLVLRNGHLIPASEGFEVRRVAFTSLEKTIPRMNPRDPLAERRSMTVGQLFQLHQATQQQYEETQAILLLPELAKIRADLSDRFSFPLMAFALALLAAPLGARSSRSGRSFAFAAGLLIALSYIFLYRLLEPVWYLPLPAALALGQLPNVLFMAVGLVSLVRVDRL